MALQDKWPPEVRAVVDAYTELEADRIAPKGANGYVVFGRHKILGTRLALKIYYYDDAVQHDEPRLLISVDNPHVLKIFDARILSKDSAYFVTPEADGGDLDEVLANGLSLDQAIEISRGVLEGLSALHAPPDRLIHRDLKPENILFHEGRPVIGDFGSVRYLPDAGDVVPASRQSILYKAPESVSEGVCDTASDVYQVGVIAYQLVGGSLSYDLLSYMGAAEQRSLARAADDFARSKIIDERIGKLITRGKLLDWNSVPAVIPRSVVNVLKRATHPSRKRRYQTASQFLAALASLPSPIPKWSSQDDGWLLEAWNGNDYRITLANGRAVVYKRRTGAELWRRDHVLSGRTLEEVLDRMHTKCRLVV